MSPKLPQDLTVIIRIIRSPWKHTLYFHRLFELNIHVNAWRYSWGWFWGTGRQVLSDNRSYLSPMANHKAHNLMTIKTWVRIPVMASDFTPQNGINQLIPIWYGHMQISYTDHYTHVRHNISTSRKKIKEN